MSTLLALLLHTAGAWGPQDKATKLPRLWLPTSAPVVAGETSWPLDAAQQRKLGKVLRLRRGDELRVFDGGVGEWVASFEDDCVVAKHQTREPEVRPQLELFFAPIKKKRLALLIEKAVELGVTRLRPIRTQRTERASISALPAPGVTAAAIAASEQSERCDVPLLDAIVDNNEISTSLPLYVCAARADEAPHLLDVVTAGDGAAVLIGPEGGLSDADLAAISGAVPHAVAVTLGPAVLRAETAACVALAFAGAALRSS
jgi:16S rRNA (uracil1498-N3)-methyltransferase